MIEASHDVGLDKIYYVNVKEIRDTLELVDGEVSVKESGTDSYYELLEKIGTVLEDYTLTDTDGNKIQTNENRIFAPNIVSIVDGKAVSMTDGISELETDPYMELTKKMKKLNETCKNNEIPHLDMTLEEFRTKFNTISHKELMQKYGF